MASKVVLVLGNTTTAGYVAELAANNASPGTVTLAIPGTPVIDQWVFHVALLPPS